MTPRRKSGLQGAILFGLFGLFLLLTARHAQLHNKLLSGADGAGWMTPTQAYVAAFLLFAAAAYSIFLGFRRNE
ncbi:MAG TPA: hypothetical protein VGW39_07840 [Chthoniobacterales bacterium]|nr:hypothetical protein [Chthoniobacterales bacterium]